MLVVPVSRSRHWTLFLCLWGLCEAPGRLCSLCVMAFFWRTFCVWEMLSTGILLLRSGPNKDLPSSVLSSLRCSSIEPFSTAWVASPVVGRWDPHKGAMRFHTHHKIDGWPHIPFCRFDSAMVLMPVIPLRIWYWQWRSDLVNDDSVASEPRLQASKKGGIWCLFCAGANWVVPLHVHASVTVSVMRLPWSLDRGSTKISGWSRM